MKGLGSMESINMESINLEPVIGIDVAVLADKLNCFETPLEIADFLRSQDIQGKIGDATSCVISNWVLRESGANHVTVAHAIKTWESSSSEEFLASHKVSAAVMDFIELFDGNNYQDLEQTD